MEKLIPCPLCRHQISNEDKTVCPNCGHTYQDFHLMEKIVGALLILGILMYFDIFELPPGLVDWLEN